MKNILKPVSDKVKQAHLLVEMKTREHTPNIDKAFRAIGQIAVGDNPFFKLIDQEELDGKKRPDAVNHRNSKTLLGPNFLTDEERNEPFELLPLLFNGEELELKDKFNNFVDNHKIFERLKGIDGQPGESFVFVLDHSELANLGYAAGLLHLSARDHGIEHLENRLTVVVGRLLGYFNLFNGRNVIDGVLRRVGSVLKTFPRGGSESLDESSDQSLSEEIINELDLVRWACNHRTRDEFEGLLGSLDGQIIIMAPSGAEDKYNSDENTITMRSFGKGTCDLMIAASEQGATIIPLSFARHTGGSILEFGEPLKPGEVRTIDDCHAVGQEIAALNTHARGVASVKHPDDDWYKSTQTYDLKAA